jgi:agmatine deiminase
VWIVSNRKPKERKGKVQLIDAGELFQKMRKSLGSKRKELSEAHIDDITRFINPETVLTVIEEDESDVNHRPLEENYQRLCRMTTEDGSPLNVITLPMPAPVILDGERLPASYANFYIANTVVLLPVFGDPRDAEAIATLQEAFPDRRIAPINSRELVWGLGSFHCLTQQVPAPRRAAGSC